MKLENSTTWPDHFLRRMLAWTCKELDMPVRTIRHARFRNSRAAWGGVARSWKGQITTCVHPDPMRFPAACSTHKAGESFADRIECLVAVTAHEAYHIAAALVPDHQQKTRGRSSCASSEAATCVAEFKVLDAFRANREALLADWNAAPAMEIKTTVSVQAIRAHAAADKLAKWERKMKAAANKVKKYRRQVAYYNRVLPLAACK